MKPAIRCAVTLDGDIEAAIMPGALPYHGRVVIDRRSGAMLETNVPEDSDAFRWLITEARKHVAK